MFFYKKEVFRLRKSIMFLLILSVGALFVISGCASLEEEAVGQEIQHMADYYETVMVWDVATSEQCEYRLDDNFDPSTAGMITFKGVEGGSAEYLTSFSLEDECVEEETHNLEEKFCDVFQGKRFARMAQINCYFGCTDGHCNPSS